MAMLLLPVVLFATHWILTERLAGPSIVTFVDASPRRRNGAGHVHGGGQQRELPDGGFADDEEVQLGRHRPQARHGRPEHVRALGEAEHDVQEQVLLRRAAVLVPVLEDRLHAAAFDAERPQVEEPQHASPSSSSCGCLLRRLALVPEVLAFEEAPDHRVAEEGVVPERGAGVGHVADEPARAVREPLEPSDDVGVDGG